MKIINYDKLFAEFKRDGAISKDANQIANTLICELCIQPGKGLARFLGVKSCFDNHMALRVWVQQRLDDNPDYLVNEMYQQLQSEFYRLLPQPACGF